MLSSEYQLAVVLVKALQRNRTNRMCSCVHNSLSLSTSIFIYFKVLTDVIVVLTSIRSAGHAGKVESFAKVNVEVLSPKAGN